MDILKLYKDHHIPIAGLGQRHYRHGWVNTPCPFCIGSGKPGNHLGFCVDPQAEHYNSFVCYRCGGKKTLDAVAGILHVSQEQARIIIASYGGISAVSSIIKPKVIKYTREAQLPPRTRRIQEVPGALKYVLNRKFDPDYLEQEWGVVATGPGSVVVIKDGDKIIKVDYSYRLIIPVYYQGRLVTYQGRDWTGKISPKYKAAHPSQEAASIKDILYGLDKAEGMRKVGLFEGVTDVWRGGPGFLSCFGIKYRRPQVLILIKRFEAVVVGFDPESQAKIQAQKIIRELREGGMVTSNFKTPKGKDPAEMESNKLRELLL